MRSITTFFRNHRLPQLSTLWLLGSLVVALCVGLGRDLRHDQTATASTNRLSVPSEMVTSTNRTGLVPTTVVPIATIQVGQQVLADNPTEERDLKFGETVDPATWRKLTLKAPKRDGTCADVTLLRPLTWLTEQNTEVGGTVKIDVPECGISGDADVLAIEPCPQIDHDHRYRIVTGVFKHQSARIVEVHIEDLAEPIGTTANHPFWSEDRKTFVRADELNDGEQLRTLNGTAKVRKVVPLKDAEPVFNLEVQCDHIYLVSKQGIVVHNSGIPGLPCPLQHLTDEMLPIISRGDAMMDASRGMKIGKTFERKIREHWPEFVARHGDLPKIRRGGLEEAERLIRERVARGGGVLTTFERTPVVSYHDGPISYIFRPNGEFWTILNNLP